MLSNSRRRARGHRTESAHMRSSRALPPDEHRHFSRNDKRPEPPARSPTAGCRAAQAARSRDSGGPKSRAILLGPSRRPCCPSRGRAFRGAERVTGSELSEAIASNRLRSARSGPGRRVSQRCRPPGTRYRRSGSESSCSLLTPRGQTRPSSSSRARYGSRTRSTDSTCSPARRGFPEGAI